MAALSEAAFLMAPSGDIDVTTTEIEQLKKEMREMREEKREELRELREENENLKKSIQDMDERFKKIEDPLHQLKATLLSECLAVEIKPLIFFDIEELYKLMKAKILAMPDSEPLLEVLDEWRKDAKARRTKKILCAATGAGIVGVAAAVVTAALSCGAVPVLASFFIAGVGGFLLVSGGMWLFSKAKDAWSRGKKKNQ